MSNYNVMNRTFSRAAALLMAAAVAPGAEGAEAPAVPSFEGMPYVAEGAVDVRTIPNVGWKVDWQRERPAEPGDVAGIKVDASEVELRGEKTPAIRITCTPGSFKGGFPLVALPIQIDFTEWNVLSFSAKVEYPEGVKPLMLDSTPMIGWFSSTFLARWDDFAINADDGCTFPWAGHGVHATDFKNHDYPATRTKDGFTDFRWDIPHEERTGYKVFVENRVKALYFMYDTRKIKQGQEVVITIADMKLVKGWHKIYAEPERYAKWLERVNGYEPDLSDSSEYLGPPKTGRLGKAHSIRLAKDGKALAEIVVDFSDAIKIDNRFPKEKWNYELRQSRGREKAMMRKAAYSLKEWLDKLTGGDFPVVERPSRDKTVKIFLGAGFVEKLFPEDLAKLGDGEGAVDGFAVRVKDGNIYIFGAHPMGTSNGVHAFLENNSDLIWAIPNDEDGTVWTVDPDLEVVWGDAIEKPDFVVRGFAGDMEWRYLNRCNRQVGGESDEGYGFSLGGGHCLSPQYYDRCEGIQDFNAMIDGKRSKPWSEYRMLCCLADPEFAGHAFETTPCVKNIRYLGSFGCVYGTDDNFGVCECPKCTAPIRTLDGQTLTPSTDNQAYYSAWLYTYLNKLDDAIQREFPGFMTSTYAYFFATTPPRIKLNKTIVPMLCNYYRKAYNQPIYAPINQDWWNIYKAWMKHSKNIWHYDYYGLSGLDHPYAEVHQEDLKAQRSIGFLRTGSEGSGLAPDALNGEERWTTMRIEWNLEQDVEQLHRYYNRRVYREAAPWIDRFRAVIRKNWYTKFPGDFQLVSELETFKMIQVLGLEQELRGYLDKALKAAKNEKSKRLIERLRLDFEAGLSSTTWYPDWPSKKLAKRPERTRDAMTAADVAFTNAMAKAEALAKSGDFVNARDAMLATLASNHLVAPKIRRDKLSRTLRALVENNAQLDAEETMKLWRAHCGDDVGAANGWSKFMEWWDGKGFVRNMADAFAQRNDPRNVARVFDLWADWDGNKLPVGLRANRVYAKIDFMRQRKYDTSGCLGQYRGILERCIRDGANATERGEAMLRLYAEERDTLDANKRLERLFKLIDDRFMNNDLRKKATLTIVDACTDGAKTDWRLVKERTLKALAAGDWSGQWRNTYHAGNNRDLRLDALLEVVEKAAKAEQKDIAADLIVKGARELGYTGDVTKEKIDLGGPDGLAERLGKLDGAMAKLGVKRP